VSSLQPGTPVDRYTLRALISTAGGSGKGIELWQAYDPVLDRPVAMRLIPASHLRATNAAEAARAAATVEHRNLVAVLDVLEDINIDDESFVAIVHEWAEGRTLTDLFEEREGESLPVADAMHLTRQIALAIVEAHRAGVIHGRIRPGCLLISGSTDPEGEGQVRVRGLAVDRALWGDSPSPAVDLPDCHGIGSLLYAFITARWPEGLADGVSGAPRHAGVLLTPTSVVAEVPALVDEITTRSIDPRIWGEIPTIRDHGRTRPVTPYGDVAAMLLALGGSTETSTRLPSLPSLPPRTPARSGSRRARRVIGRLGATVLAAAAVAGIGLVGLQLLDTAPDPWAGQSTPVSADLLTATPAPEEADSLTGFTSGLLPGQIPVSRSLVYGEDPEAHNPDTVDAAIDRNPISAWTTDTFYNPDTADLDAPIGLVLDLGNPRAVSAVRLELVGTGSSVSIRVGSSPEAPPQDWSVLAEAEAIGESIDLRSPRPVVGRYVLVWFTRLPPADSGFVGGLREISVLA